MPFIKPNIEVLKNNGIVVGRVMIRNRNIYSGRMRSNKIRINMMKTIIKQ